jgi:hypothetical protein
MLDMFAYSFAAVEILNPDLMSIAVQAKAKEKEIEPEPLQPAVQSPQKVRPVPREFLRKTPKLHQPGFGFKRRFR